MSVSVLVVASLSSVAALSSIHFSSFTKPMLNVGPTSRLSPKTNLVMYEYSKDPPSSSGDRNMWSVLSNTEKWLSSILGNSSDANNPYKRKEVSFLCELSHEDALVVAGIWRRLREGRQQGEMHGQAEEKKCVGKGESYNPPTFRQTQVVVLPNDGNLEDFTVFDALVTKINQCRRNARDLVLDVNLEKLEEEESNEIGERDWSVSVNFAHLHPNFGAMTKEQQLREMIAEEQAGEVDLNLKAHKEKRLLARRSPYPTVCIEIRATPPPDFSEAGPPPSLLRQSSRDEADEGISAADVKKLEKLFGVSAALSHPTKNLTPEQEEDEFYNAIGSIKGITEISLMSPLRLAQEWIAHNHGAFDIDTSTFGRTKCQYVDEAYEFVFNQLAMMQASRQANGTAHPTTQYLVFESLMSNSATSFEKFAREIMGLVQLLPSLKGHVDVTTLHPEHISSDKRAPVPVLVMTWGEKSLE